MNLVSLLIAPAVVMWSSRGSHPNTALRITIAIVAVLIIAAAITVAKRKPIAVAEGTSAGDNDSDADGGTPEVTDGKGGTPATGSTGSTEQKARV
jgi:K(+)-stimulated pyrophosphate-energized sodium pump